MSKSRVMPEPKVNTPPAAPADAERMTIPIKDGRVHWEGVRESRRDQLRALLAASLPAQAIPVTATEPAGSPLANAAIVGTLYDLVGQLEALAAARVMGCSMADALEAFAFSAAEKTALEQPTIKVLNKYLPASMFDRYADELTLLLMLVAMTRAKTSVLRDSLTRHETLKSVKSETAVKM